MRCVQVVARGRAEFVEAPKPELLPGQVLVRTRLLSLCGSDIKMLHYFPEQSYPFPPGTTGHEVVGVIEAVGRGVSSVRAGERVLAIAPDHCAMAEYYVTASEHVIPLPAERPLEQLLQAQQLGTVIYASQRLPNLIGKNVAVIGQGSAGLWFNFHLRRMGARRVIALDVEKFRLSLSREFGATHTVHNAACDPADAVRHLTDGELADVVVEAAGETAAINLAVELVRQYGEILYFGLPRQQDLPFNFERFFRKCCRASTIVGASLEPNHVSTRIAVDLIASGAADPESLITHRLPFESVLEAYEMHHRRADGAVKIVIQMPE